MLLVRGTGQAHGPRRGSGIVLAGPRKELRLGIQETLSYWCDTQGGHVERGVGLASYSQDDSGVTAHLTSAEGGEETLRARWIVGCDGTRSAVRAGAGIAFEGDTYKELVRLYVWCEMRCLHSLGMIGQLCLGAC